MFRSCKPVASLPLLALTLLVLLAGCSSPTSSTSEKQITVLVTNQTNLYALDVTIAHVDSNGLQSTEQPQRVLGQVTMCVRFPFDSAALKVYPRAQFVFFGAYSVWTWPFSPFTQRHSAATVTDSGPTVTTAAAAC